MAANKPNKPVAGNGEQSAANMAMGIGFAIALPLILFILAGVAIDGWLHTTPIFILVGVALALFVSGYQLYRLLKISGSE